MMPLVLANASTAIVLQWSDVALASIFVLAAGLVSIALRLGLHGRLLVASMRTIVQLGLVGFVLARVFAMQSPWAIAGVAAVMIAAAARAAVGRPERYYRGAAWRSLVTLALSAFVTTWVVTAVVVRAEPWYAARYLIPLLGMVLGNSLTGISLCIDTLLQNFDERRDEVETALACGATAWEAGLRHVRDAVRRGMVPILNSMSVVGLVSLPGMMTGQILAGADPLEAVKYQVVVMFMIAGATSAGCVGVSILSWRALFDDAHRLRPERVLKRRA